MASQESSIQKSPSGITGLDSVTQGGLPQNRCTLLCGGPGCGKTILATEFLVRGAQMGEPGLLVSFAETEQRLIENFRTLDFELEEHIQAGRIKVLHVKISPEEIVETGDFSLEALRIRIEQGLKAVGARRLVIDSPELLFAAVSNVNLLRVEVAHLLHWLGEKEVTAVLTAERGAEHLTRHGFEEYISDCVILLDHRVQDQISKRRLRVIKYRGSHHSSDEVPFLIGPKGLSILPITALELDAPAGDERVSSGVADLDRMLEGEGYFKGSSVLVSGKAGTGKSSLAMAFAVAASRRGESCLYMSFEESPRQLKRNMRSIGLDLDTPCDKGLLRIRSLRPSTQGLEEHLVTIEELINETHPTCVVLDPLSNFVSVGVHEEIKSMITRLLDRLKRDEITAVMTSLTPGTSLEYETESRVSSLMDTWITLAQEESEGQYRRTLHIIKSRGMEHSSDKARMDLSSGGIHLSLPERFEKGGKP